MTSTIVVLASAVLLGVAQQGNTAGDAADELALERSFEATSGT